MCYKNKYYTRNETQHSIVGQQFPRKKQHKTLNTYHVLLMYLIKIIQFNSIKILIVLIKNSKFLLLVVVCSKDNCATCKKTEIR